jgi:hypothetical protein
MTYMNFMNLEREAKFYQKAIPKCPEPEVQLVQLATDKHKSRGMGRVWEVDIYKHNCMPTEHDAISKECCCY